MSRSRTSVPGVDAGLLAKDAARLLREPTRRHFLRVGASLGALAFLTGCDIVDGPSAENALRIVSRFNDRVQAWLFNPNRLAPTYPESAITRPFPFNAYYREEEAPDIDEDNYKLLIEGLVDDKRPWTLDRLYALPQETQITRLVCVEGWSAIGKWTGSPLREFLRRIGAETQAHHSVDVARGLVLLFGIGTRALPSWDSRTRWNNLWGGLAVLQTVGPSGHTNSPHPSSR